MNPAKAAAYAISLRFGGYPWEHEAAISAAYAPLVEKARELAVFVIAEMPLHIGTSRRLAGELLALLPEEKL